jgi:hypothetical protein
MHPISITTIYPLLSHANPITHHHASVMYNYSFPFPGLLCSASILPNITSMHSAPPMDHAAAAIVAVAVAVAEASAGSVVAAGADAAEVADSPFAASA